MQIRISGPVLFSHLRNADATASEALAPLQIFAAPGCMPAHACAPPSSGVYILFSFPPSTINRNNLLSLFRKKRAWRALLTLLDPRRVIYERPCLQVALVTPPFFFLLCPFCIFFTRFRVGYRESRRTNKWFAWLVSVNQRNYNYNYKYCIKHCRRARKIVI